MNMDSNQWVFGWSLYLSTIMVGTVLSQKRRLRTQVNSKQLCSDPSAGGKDPVKLALLTTDDVPTLLIWPVRLRIWRRAPRRRQHCAAPSTDPCSAWSGTSGRRCSALKFGYRNYLQMENTGLEKGQSRDIQRLPTTPFSVVLRKEYFDCPQRNSHSFKRGGERVCNLVLCSLATVMSCIDDSVWIVTKSPKVGPLLIFSISLG